MTGEAWATSRRRLAAPKEARRGACSPSDEPPDASGCTALTITLAVASGMWLHPRPVPCTPGHVHTAGDTVVAVARPRLRPPRSMDPKPPTTKPRIRTAHPPTYCTRTYTTHFHSYTKQLHSRHSAPHLPACLLARSLARSCLPACLPATSRPTDPSTARPPPSCSVPRPSRIPSNYRSPNHNTRPTKPEHLR